MATVLLNAPPGDHRDVSTRSMMASRCAMMITLRPAIKVSRAGPADGG